MPATLKKRKTALKAKMKAKTKVKKAVRVVKRKAVKAKKPAMKRRTVAPSRKKPTVMKKVPLPAVVPSHGKVVHYYDRIGVAIVEVQQPFALGDFVRIRHGDAEFIQPVTSLQVEHLPVARASTGQVVGLRVIQKVPEGSVVLPM